MSYTDLKSALSIASCFRLVLRAMEIDPLHSPPVDRLFKLYATGDGSPKTLTSRGPLPIPSERASALENWRKQTSYADPGD